MVYTETMDFIINTQNYNKKGDTAMKKRILPLCVVFVLIFSILPQSALEANAETIKFGLCGDNLTWTSDVKNRYDGNIVREVNNTQVDASFTEESILDNGYISAVQQAIEDTQEYPWGSGYGALYDIDGNGLEELIMVYTIKMKTDDEAGFPAKACSVYTLTNGKAIPLINKEVLFAEAGGPSGSAGVIRADDKIYFAKTFETGETGGGSGFTINRYGNWNLYTFDGISLKLDTNIEYNYYIGDQIDYTKSTATFNQKPCSYKDYETWESSIEKLMLIDAYNYENTNSMTLDELLTFLKENPIVDVPNTIEIKAYTAFPDSTIGTQQEVKIQFSKYVNDNSAAIEDYTVDISNPSVIETTEEMESNGSKIITIKGLKQGDSDLTFTETSTGTSITLPLTVTDKCNYFRCSEFPIPYESSGSIYVADYSCSANEDGSHSISFNAYNTSYAYGVVEVYNENGNLIRLVPIDPRSDSSGLEKVVNGFKWVWEDIKDLFDGDTPFYTKENNAKHSSITLDNIPENAEIVITSDGDESDFATLYMGVDTFVRTVCTASSIDLKLDTQVATVNELMKALVDSLIKSISHDEMEKSIKQGLIKEASESISTAINFSSSADSLSDIYETVSNMLQSMDVNAEDIMLNVLKGMGYSVADASFTTAVPAYKIVNFADQILETAWPLIDYQFNIGRGKMEIHVAKHGLQNYVSNNAVTIIKRSNFSNNTVLDAYVVAETDELGKLKHFITEEITNYEIYDIILRENGREVQPDEEIEVRLPVPVGADGKKCVIYRIEENGEKTLLPSSYKDGYITFRTPHLSYYLIGEATNSSTPSGIIIISILIVGVLIIGAIVVTIVLLKRKKYKSKD